MKKNIYVFLVVCLTSIGCAVVFLYKNTHQLQIQREGSAKIPKPHFSSSDNGFVRPSLKFYLTRNQELIMSLCEMPDSPHEITKIEIRLAHDLTDTGPKFCSIDAKKQSSMGSSWKWGTVPDSASGYCNALPDGMYRISVRYGLWGSEVFSVQKGEIQFVEPFCRE